MNVFSRYTYIWFKGGKICPYDVYVEKGETERKQQHKMHMPKKSHAHTQTFLIYGQ